MTADKLSDQVVGDEKAISNHQEVAGRGQAATDQYGHALLEFDKAAESRLRWKLDLCIVPTVAVLYLFCFIDRANIGEQSLTSYLFTVSCIVHRKRETRWPGHRFGHERK